ncbi:MAG: hypothetical protein CME58_04720 [Halieaceae bacterium]|nr:hypothetical protein [Halieaceae bacterium]|tara:strand:- start:646 stop:1221 length:576 start_codon:yes stop_codon:yes gene_type:complete
MMKMRSAVALAMSALLSPLAFADWQIGPGSQVQFVSIKNNTVGEVSHFETLSGSVTDAGDVEVRVVLDSVETNVGIRNERMKTMLFEVGLYPEAVITAQLDAGSIAALSSGGATNVALQIDLHGQSVTKDAQLNVALTEQGVSATTTQPILLTAAEFGLEGGVAALQAVAGLNAISRVIPVTVALQLVPAN